MLLKSKIYATQFKVLMDYPGNKFFTEGDIISLEKIGKEEWYFHKHGSDCVNFEKSFFKSYPKIFEEIKTMYATKE